MDSNERRKELDLFKILEDPVKAFCQKARRIALERGHTQEFAEKMVDELISEFVDSVVAKLMREEQDSKGQKRLLRDVDEVREVVKSLKEKYWKR